MERTKKFNVSIVGAGRLGTTLAAAINRKKDSCLILKAVTTRTGESLKIARAIIAAGEERVLFTTKNAEVLAISDCIFFCTPDDKIKKAAEEVFSGTSRNLTDYTAIHFSGSKSLSELFPAKIKGAGICSIHPIKSFASIEGALKTLKGTIYGITCQREKEFIICRKIVEELEGKAINVDDEKKPLYHAAACIASNYLVTLMNYAVELHKRIGINPEESLPGLLSLAEGTIQNIKSLGTKKALTGPIARGDTGTIAEHMYNFKRHLEQGFENIYSIMGMETAKIALSNDWINSETLSLLNKILKKE